MENQGTTTTTDQTTVQNTDQTTDQLIDIITDRGYNLGNKSITNQDLSIEERVAKFVSMYASLEAARALLIKLNVDEQELNVFLESDSVKDKVKLALDKYSRESGVKLTSNKVNTLENDIKKLLGK